MSCQLLGRPSGPTEHTALRRAGRGEVGLSICGVNAAGAASPRTEDLIVDGEDTSD